MFIEIDDSVIDFLNNNEKVLKGTSTEIVALISLARSYYNGDHIIIATSGVLEYLSTYKMFGQFEHEVFTSLLGKSYYLENYKHLFNFFVTVHKSDYPFHESKSHYYIPLQYFESLKKSVIISENLRDTSFYVNLCKEMIRENYKDAMDTDISLRQVQCAGSDAYRTVDNEMSNRNFVLIIMDSDKESPEDSVGPSANQALRIFRKYESTNIIDCIILNVRAKENVVPPTLLLLCENPNNQKLLLTYLAYFELDPKLSETLKYMDIKNGITLGLLKSLNLTESPIYKSIEESATTSIGAVAGIGCEYIEKFNTDVLIYQLDKRVNELSNIPNIPKHNIEIIQKKAINSHRILSLLPDYIKDIWDDIYNSLLSYGCCISEESRLTYI